MKARQLLQLLESMRFKSNDGRWRAIVSKKRPGPHPMGEAKNTVLPVIETTKPTRILVCPHCQQEIYEKHTFTQTDMLGEHVHYHSDCGGAIKFPPPKPEEIAYLNKMFGLKL